MDRVCAERVVRSPLSLPEFERPKRSFDRDFDESPELHSPQRDEILSQRIDDIHREIEGIRRLVEPLRLEAHPIVAISLASFSLTTGLTAYLLSVDLVVGGVYGAAAIGLFSVPASAFLGRLSTLAIQSVLFAVCITAAAVGVPLAVVEMLIHIVNI